MPAEAKNELKFKNGNISTFEMGLPRKSPIIGYSKTILEDKRVITTDSQKREANRFPNKRSQWPGVNITIYAPEIDNFEIITDNNSIIDKN